MRALSLTVALALSACMLDEEAPPDEAVLGAAASDVTTTNLVTWPFQNDGANGSEDWDLGPSNGRACFLAGLRGFGRVRIVELGGHWIAQTEPFSNLQLTTVCVTSANQALTSEVVWNGGASVLVASPAPGRRCFLTGATSNVEGAGQYGELSSYRGYWMLGGTSSNRFYARCLTTTTTINSVAVAAPTNGTATVVAAANPGGVACALTGLGVAVAPLAHSDVPWSASLRYQDGGWFLDAGNGRSGRATCFQ